MSEFEKLSCTCSHGYTCRNMQDPNCCAHSCDYNDLVDEFYALQAERDALMKEKLYLASRLDEAADRVEMNIREKQEAFEKCRGLESQLADLAAHDAEVAKAAFIAGYELLEKSGPQPHFRMHNVIGHAENYAASLNK